MISTYLKTGAKTLWNFAVLPLLVWAAWYTKHPIFPFALGFLYIISVFSFALICFGFWKALDADLHIPDDGGGGGGGPSRICAKRKVESSLASQLPLTSWPSLCWLIWALGSSRQLPQYS